MMRDIRCILWMPICILALISAACASEPDKTGQENDLKRFADVRIGEDEALRVIEHIRQAAPTKEEAEAWARVANSDKYSDVRRRRAIFQLFDRHVRPGMTLGEMANLLAKPSWLKRENLCKIVGPAWGYVPIRYVGAETGFSVSLCLPSKDSSGVYVRVKDFPAGDALTKDSLYGVLQGKKTDATGLKITAIVVYPGTIGDLAYVKHNFEQTPRSDIPPSDVRKPSRKPLWPRHWEIVFSTDKTDVYARQLDFFGIELGVLLPDNKIAYAFHLTKKKPDTRVVADPATNENRYYLTWRLADSRKADQKLLKRAGIEAGNRLILNFLPRDVEGQLIILERDYRGSTPPKIARTRFGVRAAGQGFEFYVLEQTLKGEK